MALSVLLNWLKEMADMSLTLSVVAEGFLRNEYHNICSYHQEPFGSLYNQIYLELF